MISPSVGLNSRTHSLPIVVFPDPLSPASPRTSPFSTSKETPSTALTNSAFRDNKESTRPFDTEKYILTFFTSMSGNVLLTSKEMTCYKSFTFRFNQIWLNCLANFHHMFASRVVHTTGDGID